MSLNHHSGGPNLVPAYQMSGIPYVTSSAATEVPRLDNANGHPIQVSFPFVTKFLTIRNIGANALRVAFSYTGSQTPGQGAKGSELTRNYFLLPAAAAGKNDTTTFEVRCKSVFFAGEGGTTGFSVLAGLTTINASQFPILTGSVGSSAGFQGVG